MDAELSDWSRKDQINEWYGGKRKIRAAFSNLTNNKRNNLTNNITICDFWETKHRQLLNHVLL